MKRYINRQGTCLSLRPASIYKYPEYSGPGVGIWWMGQAGFLLRYRKLTLLIDPYLSDYLSDKYSGKKYPHIRMMKPPINPSDLRNIDYYLCSHAHSDHMDPGLIPLVAKNNPECLFILPESAGHTGNERGIASNRMILLDDGRTAVIDNELTIHGVAAAHEGLDKNPQGNYLYLGYIIKMGNFVVYHSGDCVLYPRLIEKLESFKINLALLPVNGRQKSLSRDGIAGNFFPNEVFGLLNTLNFDFMIPHHYGMFDFNTIDSVELKKSIVEQNLELRIYPAELDILFELEGCNG